MAETKNSKMTFSELTFALGQVTQLLNRSPYGSPLWVKINEIQERLYRDLEEGNYK